MKTLCIRLMVTGFGVLAINTAQAIITRHDVPDSNYIVANADYPALVTLFQPDDCIGTLVHKSYLLTVAHCAADLNVGDVLQVSGVSHAVAKIILHPKWREDHDNYDIALLRFKKPVKGVSPFPVYRKVAELGSAITLIGRGFHGTGLQGEPNSSSDGKLRRATNTVSSVNKHFIEIYFKRPGQVGVTKLEGVGASGDSGGPSFIDVNGVPHIAGLNSWGKGDKGIEIGQYGSTDNQTRVSQYIQWLDSIVDIR